jgi:hypothetical protein
MAKDLGTITHNIKTTGGSGGGGGGGGGGRSNTDATSGSGRSGGGIGGIGEVIRGLSRGGPLGGGQAMAKVMGFAKLAAGIGVAIAAFALVTIAVKKVIGTLVRWGKEIENGIKKFGSYNAEIAATSALMQVGQITRDIKTASVLSGTYASTGRRMEQVKDAFRPVADAWLLIKANLVNAVMPVLERLVEALRLMTIKILETIVWFNEAGITTGDVAGTLIDAALFGPSGYGFSQAVLGLGEESETDIEMLEAMKGVISELKKMNQNNDIKGLNQFVGEVGVQLTGGRWNPWEKPGTHMIPTGEPNNPRTPQPQTP